MLVDPPDPTHPLCGIWRCYGKDSDHYYRAEYTIGVSSGEFQVSAIDRSDGEELEISDVHWNGVSLTFHSYVPSTERCGISQVRYVGDGKVEFIFTFTVREIWGRAAEVADDGGADKASPGNF